VPTVHPTAFVHEHAIVIGNVSLGARVSVWPTAVIRGDSDSITIGDDSNVQDGTVIHADAGLPTTIGKRVAIGHRAIVHGSTVEDDCLIAMGAILLNGVHVGTGSIVGAGAMCPEGMKIPPNSLALGIPARVLREVTSGERVRIRETVETYVELQAEHRNGKFSSS
jgi:carbonic anhydrase/acetyltransferase-like protein (isoleucine patch superfamily)